MPFAALARSDYHSILLYLGLLADYTVKDVSRLHHVQAAAWLDVALWSTILDMHTMDSKGNLMQV